MRKIFRIIEKLFKRKRWVSRIETYYGEKYDLSRGYKHLIDRDDVRITSVSVTRVDSGGYGGYAYDYLVAISYDLQL